MLRFITGSNGASKTLFKVNISLERCKKTDFKLCSGYKEYTFDSSDDFLFSIEESHEIAEFAVFQICRYSPDLEPVINVAADGCGLIEGSFEILLEATQGHANRMFNWWRSLPKEQRTISMVYLCTNDLSIYDD